MKHIQSLTTWGAKVTGHDDLVTLPNMHGEYFDIVLSRAIVGMLSYGALCTNFRSTLLGCVPPTGLGLEWS